ncbi:MAG: methionine synthase [Anaerolineales bacterium]|nr:methionine synthase [Anaerolineales bacterium]
MKNLTQYTRKGFIQALEERVMVYDGANGTMLQAMNLTADDFGGEQFNGCYDYLAISKPEAVEAVHRAYFEVGVDVVETNTFRANPLTLEEYGLGDLAFEINKAAAEVARKAAEDFSTSEQPRFVAGSIGPSGMLPSADDPTLSDITYDQLVEIFRVQAGGLIAGGVDVLLIETSQDILEVKAAIEGIQKAFEDSGEVIPIQCQVTLDTSGRMLLGTDIASALTILEKLPIAVIGLNCSTGPEHMREPISFLGKNAALPVSAIPNAGLPLNVDGQAVYPLEPVPYAEAMHEFVTKFNVSVVGGCCGTTPAHLEKLVEKVHGQPTPERPHHKLARLSSSISAVDMAQEPRPFLIGERLNATGSRAFKRMLLAKDWDAMVELARDQINGGAHALDISVAVTEDPDEIGLMTTLVKRLAMSVEAPLVIDTTEPEVMEAALKVAPGRCLLNSTHLEAGPDKLHRVLEIAKRHNAAVLILTIDEDGMAKTVERKLEIARRIYEFAVNKYSFAPEDLVYDTLTFPLSTGDPEFANSAVATIDSIRQIKAQLPGVFTSLGVSNVSFGLSPAARPVLNSMMLHFAVQAGLDMAIVHASKVRPYVEIPEEERKLMEDLIFNKRPDALQRVIEFYQHVQVSDETGADPTEGMTPEERLYWSILHRHKEGVEAAIDEIINRKEMGSDHESAVNILNNTLLPAMKEVGDRFGAGELILPFVLQSAEVMKKTVSHLDNYLEKLEGISKGKVVLATVYGDVHDIGKNLVKTILANNGYEVVDLGKQVPADTIISKAEEVGADAIGLSALLVSTSKQMPLIVNQLQRRGMEIPVLIGGAAINRRFGWRILQTESGVLYPPGVFYCADAFEGLSVMERLVDEEKRQGLLEELVAKAETELDRKPRAKKAVAEVASRVPPAKSIPNVPGWGPRLVAEMPLQMVFEHLSIKELFRLSWGAKNTRGEEWERLQREFQGRLDRMKREAQQTGWLKPQGVYGYWPAQAEGNDLLIYAPDSLSGTPSEIARFSFPRQGAGEGLCLADYFSAADSGRMDVVALQVVTVGQQATDQFDALQEEGDYSAGYYVHGLAVQTAEAAAEYLHRHIRRELGLPEGQGKRYSWGYPAIPDLDDHRIVFNLLPAEEQLGMSLTSAFQLVPEQSTAAIVIHHPEAKYYSTGTSRVEQLMGE